MLRTASAGVSEYVGIEREDEGMRGEDEHKERTGTCRLAINGRWGKIDANSKRLSTLPPRPPSPVLLLPTAKTQARQSLSIPQPPHNTTHTHTRARTHTHTHTHTHKRTIRAKTQPRPQVIDRVQWETPAVHRVGREVRESPPADKVVGELEQQVRHEPRKGETLAEMQGDELGLNRPRLDLQLPEVRP